MSSTSKNPSYVRRAVRGASIIFLMGLLASFFGYLLRFLLARKLTPEEFGLIYSILALFGTIQVFKELGLRPALSKHISSFMVHKQFGKIKGAFVIVLAKQLALTVIIGSAFIFFARILAREYFHTAGATLPVIIYAIAFMIHPLHAMFKPTFQGFQFMKLYSLIDFLKIIVAFIFTGLFLMLGYGVSAPMIAYGIAFVGLPVFVYMPLLYRRVKSIPGFMKAKIEVNFGVYKKLMLFGLPLILGEVAGLIMSNIDTLILTYYSLTQVGLYNVALPVSKLLWRFASAFTTVLFPLSSELWERKEKAKLERGMHTLHKYTSMIIVPLAIIMFFFAEMIIQLLFGMPYVGAANALRVLALGSIFYTMAQINLSTLLGTGNPVLVTKLTVFVGVLNLIGNVLLIPHYGMMGAVITTFLSFVLLLIFSTIKLNKVITLTLPWKIFGKVLVLNVLFSGLIYSFGLIFTYLEVNRWAAAAIVVLLASALYVLGLFIFRIVSKKEILHLWKLVVK